MAKTTRLQTAAVVALTATTLVAGPATAASRHRLPDLVVGTATALHPQGVAWDQRRGAFVVGSIRDGTVSTVAPDGTVRLLAAHERMISTTGVHVDARRDRLLVAHADVGLGTRTSPDTVMSRSGLAVVQLSTGRVRQLVDLDHTPGPRVATEVTVDDAGTAYVTDSVAGAIYRVDRHGRARLLATDPRFAPPPGAHVGIAGIVWHPAGHLLAVNTGTGALFRVTPSGRVTEVALDRPLSGADGLVLTRDGTLVVVANTLGGTGSDTVHAVRGVHGWSAARTVADTPWPDHDPTTVALTPAGPYVLAGRIRELATGQPAGPFHLRRWELS